MLVREMRILLSLYVSICLFYFIYRFVYLFILVYYETFWITQKGWGKKKDKIKKLV